MTQKVPAENDQVTIRSVGKTVKGKVTKVKNKGNDILITVNDGKREHEFDLDLVEIDYH